MKLEKLNLSVIRYLIYLGAHGLVMVAVVLFFRWIPNIKIAALFAGALFLLGPILVIYGELSSKIFPRSFSSIGALVFLVFSALPIMSLRLLNWDEKFENLSLFGVSAPRMHQISNSVFMGMLFCFVTDLIVSKRKARSQKSI